MTLDDFLSVTEQRIPTVDEMIGLCEELKIGFRMVDGIPCLRTSGSVNNEAEAVALSKLFRREPFRSKVIQEKMNGVAAVPSTESVQEDEIDKPPVPDNAIIVRADKDGYMDKAMRGPVHMWTWVGATVWYAASIYPVP